MFALDRLWVNNKIRGRDGNVPRDGFRLFRALLIKSREAPILRRGVYSRRSSLLGERSKVNFYRGLSECGERIGILASFYPEDR